MNETLRFKLREARWRLIWNDFVAASAWTLLAGLTVGLGLEKWLGGTRPWVFPLVLAVPLLVGWVRAFLRWRSPQAVARALDALGGTKDRFSVAMETGRRQSEWGEAIRREAEQFVRNFRVGERIRLAHPGRQYAWMLVPLALVLAMNLVERARLSAVRGELAVAQKMIEEVRRITPTADPDVARAAEELAETEKKLPESAEPLRETLRALAELERKLAEAQGGLSPAETAALADAVAASSPQVASDLRAGNDRQAAEGLARLDPEALAQALREAAKHLENRRLEELAQHPRMGQQLAGMLRSSDGSGEGQRKKFLSALRDIKQGNPGRDDGDEGPSGGEGAPNEAPNGSQKPDPGLADNAPPGGAPGSDRDLGQGDDLGGAKDPGGADPRADEFVAGVMGEGASLVEMLRSAGADDPKARRAWRSAWDSAAPAALDAVAKDDVPAGSRLVVKRYFESIRPRE